MQLTNPNILQDARCFVYYYFHKNALEFASGQFVKSGDKHLTMQSIETTMAIDYAEMCLKYRVVGIPLSIIRMAFREMVNWHYVKEPQIKPENLVPFDGKVIIYNSNNTVEQFIRVHGCEPCRITKTNPWVKALELYEKYKEWCLEMTLPCETFASFGRCIRALGFSAKRLSMHKYGGKQGAKAFVYYMRINHKRVL